jgi:NAD(P)-dependent dehydrogenase (short-subunit alcohol dehydrogenase family)
MTGGDDADSRHIVITGGNRGIGYALVGALSSRGDPVTFTARNYDRGAAALSRLRRENPRAQLSLELCDLTSVESIKSFARKLVAEKRPVHALVHNAGVLRAPGERQLTASGIEITLATNALGPALLTTALLPALAAAPASRVLILTSRLHHPGSRGAPVDFAFDDPNLEHGYDRDRAYKNSKLAAIWVARELDRVLPPSVTCNAICPGFVPSTAASYATGWQRLILQYVLPRFAFTRTVDEAAADVIWALDADELSGVGGRYLADRSIASPSAEATDPALARRFWHLAESLLKQPLQT